LLYFCAKLRANVSGRVCAAVIENDDFVAELGVVVKHSLEVAISLVAGEKRADNH
jgi:hypothetical protein